MTHLGTAKHFDWRAARADDALFLLSYALWLVVTITAKTTFLGSFVTGAYWNIVCWVCMGFLVVSEALSLRRGIRWTWKSVVGFLACVVLAVCCFRANRITTLSAIPFIFCARNRDLRSIFKVSIVAMAITMAVVMLAAHQGLINNAIETSNDGRTRHYLGFRYPLRPAMIMFAITGMALYLLGRKLDVYSAGMLLLVNVSIFCLTGSRVSFVLSVVAIAICFLGAVYFRMRPNGGWSRPRGRLLACLFASCFVIAAAFALYTSWCYDPHVSWMLDLNKRLDNRLALSHAVIEKYGASVFGRKVSMVGNGLSLDGQHSGKQYFYADSLYIQQVIMYGLVFFASYIASMSAACFKNFRNGSLVAVVLLVLMSVHGVVDNLTLDLWLDPLLFFASGLMAEKASRPSP